LTDHPEKADIVSKAKSIVLAMKFEVEKPSQETEDQVWSKITRHINTEQIPSIDKKRDKIGIIRMMMYGAAAAIAILLLFQNIGNDYDTSVNVPFAKIENVTLPDGSKIMINSGSELKYDTKSWDVNRLISLKGEAFFSVEKGSKFTVKTNNGSVQVLGTSFNVYDRGEKMKVLCETGKVAVKSAGKETILTPEQSVSIVNRSHSIEKDIPINNRRSSWKQGIYVYKGSPLKEVVAELERQFDISVTMDNSLSDISYTGSFSILNRENAFTEVFYPLGLKFDVDGKNVRLSN
jgi:ferric-dicitrate binding protein FerR (iron transport regulator)